MKVRVNTATKLLSTWAKRSDTQYEPLIKVWNSPKGNRRHLLKGYKAAPRQHHFLSDGEKRAGIYYESLPSVIDYFEQYPLLDLERAIRIAAEMNIRYPTNYNDGEAYVLSTDLLCREYDSDTHDIVFVARSYKPLDSLDFQSKHPVSLNRTFEKLELERRYYEELGIRFELVTDANISKTCAYNLKYFRNAAWLKHEYIAHQERFIRELMNTWFAKPDVPFNQLLPALIPKLGLSYSDLEMLFDYCAWSHAIPVDLEVKFHRFRPLTLRTEKGRRDV